MRKEEKMSRSLRKVEKKLQTALQPVEPDQGFAADLRFQLDQAMEKRNRASKVKKGILVAGGVVGVIVMLVTIIRSLTSWEEMAETVSRLLSKKEREHQTASV